MYRLAFEKLKKWQKSPNRKPLILRGARQVGKTWLLKHFGEECYRSMIYINMEDTPSIKGLFELDLDPRRIIDALEKSYQTKIIPGKTLIIFDEIQEVPKALTSLKYFFEGAPEYHVVVAGSLFGVALHQGTSFPVGKVEFLDVYPLNFSEFLRAVRKPFLADLVLDANYPTELLAFHDELNMQLKNYFVVGGMPEAVDAYVNGQNFAEIRDVEKRIIDAYELDFSKHAPYSETPKIRDIYDTIPTCLTRENKKFLLNAIRESARAREYDLALLWIEDTGLATKVTRVNSAKIPLSVYANRSIFKLFMSDIGLLGAKIGLDPKALLESADLLVEYKGALSEQFVFQEFKAAGIIPYYFSNDDSRGEIDFLVEAGTDILPIEVKSGKNLNSVSLNNFINKWKLRKAVKLSTRPIQINDAPVDNLPLYLAGTIGRHYGRK